MKSKPVAIPLDYVAEVSMRLAHIGDQVFGLVVTDLIQNLYPYLRVGRASVRHRAVLH
jgi:dsRNA-specific ribonuclease